MRIFIVTLLAVSSAQVVHAASEEIQVYLDDKEPAGKLSVDLHNNWVASGDSQSPYPGGVPPVHLYRLTPELNYGLTDTLELGAYALSSYRVGHSDFDGGKIRLKYIAPHNPHAGAFWGANLEIGRTNLTTNPIPWNGELKAIGGWRGSGWTLGGNLNTDFAISPHAGPTTADVDVKIMKQVVGDTALGIESYNELGAYHHFDALNQNSKTLYATVDTTILGHDLNFGVGRGLTNSSDQWIVKFIINFKLN